MYQVGLWASWCGIFLLALGKEGIFFGKIHLKDGWHRPLLTPPAL